MPIGRLPSLEKLRKLGSSKPSNEKELVSNKAKEPTHKKSKSIFSPRKV